MKAVIVGLGQFGRAAALAFARSGAETVAIDLDMEAIKHVQDEVDLAVRTDASSAENLEAQGVGHADVLIAGIGNDFEAQVLTVVHAKKLGVTRVLARAISDTHARALLAVGADEVLNPERDAAETLVLRLMTRMDGTQRKLTPDASAIELAAPSGLIGRPLRAQTLDFLDLSNVHLVALLRGDDPNSPETVTDPESRIEEGDRLLVVGRDGDIAALTQKLGIKAAPEPKAESEDDESE